MEFIHLFPDAGLLELSAVERGPDGLPTAWPLLRSGDNHLTLRGRPANLKLTPDDLAGIVAYHQAKGVKIPIDSRHVLSNLAQKAGLDESEVLRRLPRLAGTAGFGHLELRGDALYLSEVEFNDLAREVMRSDMIRYFSPTIHGLDGKSPLRVTSVALDNEPCLQRPACLAASESGDDDTMTPAEMVSAIEQLTKTKGGINMPETPPVTAGPDSELLAILREILGADLTPETLKSTLAALKVKADQQPQLADQVKQLQLAEEQRNLNTHREKGLSSGKLTQALLEKPFFANMTAVELSGYLDSVEDGCAVPVGMLGLSSRDSESKTTTASKKFNSAAEAIAAAPVTNM